MTLRKVEGRIPERREPVDPPLPLLPEIYPSAMILARRLLILSPPWREYLDYQIVTLCHYTFCHYTHFLSLLVHPDLSLLVTLCL